MTDYARSQGFGSWEEYQTYLSQHQGGGGVDPQVALQEAAEPIYAELDRQIGLLPEQRANLEAQVSNLYGTQTTEAGGAKEREMGGLAGAEERETGRKTKSLREISEGARNLLQAAGNIWGGSSAVSAATAGIAKQVGKQRGNIFEQANAAYSELDRKRADVESLFTQQTQKIEAWKSNKMLEISQYIRDVENSLRGQKADIRSNLTQQALAFAQQKAAKLEQMAQQYTLNMQAWREQRGAELSDWMTKLQATAKYQSGQDFGYNIPGISATAPSVNQAYTGYGFRSGEDLISPWNPWEKPKV